MGNIIKNLMVGLVHIFNSENLSRKVSGTFEDEADKGRVIRALFEGWNPKLGLPSCWKLAEDSWIDRAVQERETEWERLKVSRETQSVKAGDKTYNVSATDVLRAWENLYTKNGKVITPQYGLVAAFRRTTVLPYVNAIRFQEGLEPILELAYEIQSDSSDQARFEANLAENLLKSQGNRAMGMLDKFAAGHDLFQRGYVENRLRKLFGVGTAQKFYKLYTLDQSNEDLGIVSGVLEKKYDLAKMDKEDLRELVDAEADKDSIRHYLENPVSKGTTIMDAKRRAGLMKNCPSKVVREIVGMVHESNEAALTFYIENAGVLNEIVDMLRTVKAESVREFVAANKQAPVAQS